MPWKLNYFNQTVKQRVVCVHIFLFKYSCHAYVSYNWKQFSAENNMFNYTLIILLLNLTNYFGKVTTFYKLKKCSLHTRLLNSVACSNFTHFNVKLQTVRITYRISVIGLKNYIFLTIYYQNVLKIIDLPVFKYFLNEENFVSPVNSYNRSVVRRFPKEFQ